MLKKQAISILAPIAIGLFSLIACNTTSNQNVIKANAIPTTLTPAWQTGKNLLLTAPWNEVGSLSWKPDESEITVGDRGYYYNLATEPFALAQTVRTEGYNLARGVWNKAGTVLAVASDSGIKFSNGLNINFPIFGSGLALLDWSPDGQYIVTQRRTYNGVLALDVYSASIGNRLRTFGSEFNLRDLDWSDSTNKVLLVGDNTKIYNADTGFAVWSVPNTNQPVKGKISPTGDRVAIAFAQSPNIKIEIYNTETGALIQTIPTITVPTSLSWNPSGTQIGGGSNDGISTIWNAETGEIVQTLTPETKAIKDLQWSPSGTRITVASGSELIFYSAITFKEQGRVGSGDVAIRKNNVYGLAYNSTGTELLEVGRNNNIVAKYNAINGKSMNTFAAHAESIYGAAYNADGTKFVTASSDGTSIIWNSSNNTPISTLNGHAYTVRGAAWGANNIATASWDSTAKLWNPDTAEEIATIQHTDFVNAVAFNPNNTQVATGSSDRTLKISSSTDGILIKNIDTPAAILSLAWNSSGTQIVVGATDKRVYVYDSMTGALLKTLTGHIGAVRAVLWNKDDTAIISGGDDGNVKLWDVQTNTELTNVKPSDKFAVFALALSPSGTTVVAGTANGVTVAYTLQ
jgi:WD40 repeat protein